MQKIESTEKYILWLLWWVGLGVLSSVGLGTGLHTFLIYLGPHIAQVSDSSNDVSDKKYTHLAHSFNFKSWLSDDPIL